MAKRRELKIGEQFRNWTIVKEGKNNDSGQRMVIAKCTCGQVAERVLSSVVNSKRNACNLCWKKPARRKMYHKTKSEYGLLTVIGQNAGPKHLKNIKVRCICGVEKYVALKHLEGLGLKSCGCRGRGRKTVDREEPTPTTDIEKIWMNGRMVSLEVDNSKPTQPRTMTQQYREQGICQKCEWYLNYCLEKEMQLKCRLTEQEREVILELNGKQYDLEQVLNI